MLLRLSRGDIESLWHNWTAVHGDRLFVSVDVVMWYSLWQRTILGKGADDAAWLPHVSNVITLLPHVSNVITLLPHVSNVITQLIIFLPTQK